MELLFVKKLTATDIQKRLSVPTEKKKCFLTFGGKHKVEFKVIDSKGKVWSFGCSIRKNEKYPKPVLSKGWLQFVRCWELAIGDEVKVYRSTDKAGKVHNIIDVIKREVPPLVQNHGADRATAVASNTDVDEAATITSNSSDRATAVASNTDVGEVATITSNSSDRATAIASYTDTSSTDQTVSYDQTEGLHNQPATQKIMAVLVLAKPLLLCYCTSYLQLPAIRNKQDDYGEEK